MLIAIASQLALQMKVTIALTYFLAKNRFRHRSVHFRVKQARI